MAKYTFESIMYGQKCNSQFGKALGLTKNEENLLETMNEQEKLNKFKAWLKDVKSIMNSSDDEIIRHHFFWQKCIQLYKYLVEGKNEGLY